MVSDTSTGSALARAAERRSMTGARVGKRIVGLDARVRLAARYVHEVESESNESQTRTRRDRKKGVKL